MAQKPRCKKCGRVLRNPVSIARGMGPVCAGDTGRAGRRLKVRPRRSSGRTYDPLGNSSQLLPLPVQIADQQEPTLTKRERIRLARAEQRRSARSSRKANFLSRQSFQVGINTHTREAVIYSPVAPDGWVDNQGRQISHESLGSYLQRYQFI